MYCARILAVGGLRPSMDKSDGFPTILLNQSPKAGTVSPRRECMYPYEGRVILVCDVGYESYFVLFQIYLFAFVDSRQASVTFLFYIEPVLRHIQN